ncbi:MAG: long-chain-acyl-CoA synthetase [Myxococcales bacterium]|nr:long-chain-acyl-CoA synthetase [Myxococcales bacterium]
MTDEASKRRSRAGLWRRIGHGAQNAVEILRGGRFAAPYRAHYEVLYEDARARLRYYAPDGPTTASVLLVPPLMVTAEIYDISPELSAVGWLRARGVATYVVDFGKPESEEGGLKKTLDDHVLAVDHAVSEVLSRTGRPVHLGGYSQGGMFVYQCAAYRKCEGLASLITFGSPVDIHRNLPAVRDDVASRIIRGARDAVAPALEQLEGLPGALTSTGFRVLSARKELQQVVELFQVLHDRDALERREKRRRFLMGEGFVAWPGPALRTFIDEFVVNNRMADGGFVIANKTITLADIDIPILCFVGETDEIARAASVRAIHDAAPRAAVHECRVPAGHFGLVVGGRSLGITWPAVREWLLWRDGAGPKPAALRTGEAPADAEEAAFDDVELGVEFFYDLATDLVEELWGRIGDASTHVGSAIDVIRWQLPRIAKLKRVTDDSHVSMGRALAEQAAAIPDATFFLWQGRAFTYRDANERVTNVAAGLWTIGVRPGDVVALYMSNRPTYLSVVCALSRIGAVAALVDPEAHGEHLAVAIGSAAPKFIVCDPERAPLLKSVWRKKVHVIGGGVERKLPKRFVDMEAIDVAGFEFPPEVALDAGKGGDLAMLLFTSGTTGLPKAARITNRRWALGALGTAAACRLTSNDTVYLCLPLHHATAVLVAVGGALVGGARLALAPRFSTTSFWSDVRRYGATVVFYVGELCRYLVNAPEVPGERKNPVRVFAGTGMREDVWRQLLERFDPDRVVEFYGSTEGTAVLANLDGAKIGSVGRALPGSPELALLAFDANSGDLVERDGHLVRCANREPGILCARVVTGDPIASFDGYTDPSATESRLLRDVFEPGDVWFSTGDVLRRDEDGDYFFVDRVGDTFRWKGENVSTELVESVLSRVDSTEMVAAYGVSLPHREGRAGMVALVLSPGASFDGRAYYDAATRNLSPAARPVFLRLVDGLQLTASFKVKRRALAAEGADPLHVDRIYRVDDEVQAYVPLDVAAYAALGG